MFCAANETCEACQVCDRPMKHCRHVRKCKSRGLGDTVAKVTKAIGIKPCGGCKERQRKLNKLIPFGGGSDE